MNFQYQKPSQQMTMSDLSDVFCKRESGKSLVACKQKVLEEFSCYDDRTNKACMTCSDVIKHYRDLDWYYDSTDFSQCNSEPKILPRITHDDLGIYLGWWGNFTRQATTPQNDPCLKLEYAIDNYGTCCANFGYLKDGHRNICSKASSFAKPMAKKGSYSPPPGPVPTTPVPTTPVPTTPVPTTPVPTTPVPTTPVPTTPIIADSILPEPSVNKCGECALINYHGEVLGYCSEDSALANVAFACGKNLDDNAHSVARFSASTPTPYLYNSHGDKRHLKKFTDHFEERQCDNYQPEGFCNYLSEL